VLDNKPAGSNLFGKTVGEFIAEMSVQLYCMDNRSTGEQCSSQGTVSGTDFKHMATLYPSDTGYAVNRIWIDEEVLVVMRSHVVVKT
jgi:hypothetical protein